VSPFRTDVEQSVAEAAAEVRRLWSQRPKAVLVLGTGLNELADAVSADVSLPYAQLPGFSPTTAPGHAGQLVCGRLAGVPVVVFRGRWHVYEGHSLDEAAWPALLAARLGAQVLLLTSAAGGLNPQLDVGQVVLIDDHLNLLWQSPTTGLVPLCRDERHGPLAWVWRRRCEGLRPYDRRLAEIAQTVARAYGFELRRVVYAAMLGPNYETRAEYRLLRFLGADVVGMSTVPEALAAAAHGVRVLALSVVTNVYRSGGTEKLHSDDVVRAAKRAEPRVAQLVQGVLQRSDQWERAFHAATGPHSPEEPPQAARAGDGASSPQA